MNVLALEAYYGGSHRAYLDTLVRHSAHSFELLTLPARKWKWRMRGSAMWFARQLAEAPKRDVDLILTSDMTNVADLRALLPAGLRGRPILCYFHENQLTYPLSPNDRRDYQFGFTNITSCLASDAVWFNSHAHREAFILAAADLLGQMPDHLPAGVIDEVKGKSEVHYPLVEPPPEDVVREDRARNDPPVILWSHRWEYDKNPEPFFESLIGLDEEGVDFRLVLLGESFREAPSIFAEAWPRLMRKTIHRGFAPDRESYWRLLNRCDIVVSTAIQENFGISVVEAILAGCLPLLPNRLSYPELIPKWLHDELLYDNDTELPGRLRRSLQRSAGWPDLSALRDHVWQLCVPHRCKTIYDKALASMVQA